MLLVPYEYLHIISYCYMSYTYPCLGRREGHRAAAVVQLLARRHLHGEAEVHHGHPAVGVDHHVLEPPRPHRPYKKAYINLYAYVYVY